MWSSYLWCALMGVPTFGPVPLLLNVHALASAPLEWLAPRQASGQPVAQVSGCHVVV